MRVIVIGAGIGGLALAQALLHNGIDVVVHDRDPRADATGGYRLHIDDTASGALRKHLPAAPYQALLASSPSRSAQRGISFADHKLRVLGNVQFPLEEEVLLVGRVALRVLLAHGLDDAIRWSSEYVRHETHADGTVTAYFADGTTDHGDVLVGADGSTSRVARALAGRSTSAPVGIGGIAGRTPLTPEIREMLPQDLLTGSVLAVGPDGGGAFLTLFDNASGSAADPKLSTRAFDEPSAVYWGVNFPIERLPNAREIGAEAAVQIAVGLLRTWAPLLRTVVAAADLSTVGTFRYHAADPEEHLTPWASGTVTALGDAVHAMPPTGGRAAATAIRDADLLATHLAEAAKGLTTIPLAVHEYERGLATYAAEAVRVSMVPIVWQKRMTNPLLGLAARAGLAIGAPIVKAFR
ncbi:NAD(P)/FAD-dependent oxidoreductase [Streptomyces sp. Tu102]|uniref:FAD-dependent oxidoreductase n=1 Tax=Streptomyces TaxID=1883 RepID=UPI001BDDBE2B|nr:NAD(P)/FAD-dependent oxidoreductase [Streptomyces sp. Tu102]MBT1093455.1 FAD-dependent monooxygenase [Streptomyces sp. Tu102]